jgi:hypothetical protein
METLPYPGQEHRSATTLGRVLLFTITEGHLVINLALWVAVPIVVLVIIFEAVWILASS